MQSIQYIYIVISSKLHSIASGISANITPLCPDNVSLKQHETENLQNNINPAKIKVHAYGMSHLFGSQGPNMQPYRYPWISVCPRSFVTCLPISATEIQDILCILTANAGHFFVY